MENIEINIGDLCTHCGRDTSEALFVNRIPSGADGTLVLAGGDEVKVEVEVTGYMCADCQSVECDECGNKVLHYSIRGLGWAVKVADPHKEDLDMIKRSKTGIIELKIVCSDCEEVNQAE